MNLGTSQYSSNFRFSTKCQIIPESPEYQEYRINIRNRFRKMVRKIILQKLLGYSQKLIKLISIHNDQQGFQYNINPVIFYCFKRFCKALEQSIKLRYLVFHFLINRTVDLSDWIINQHFALMLANALKKNQSLQYISFNNSGLSAFSLSTIIKAISQNKTLKGINFSNNQNFSEDVVKNLIEYLLKGQNNISFIILTHCNIESYLLTLILQNLKHSKSLKYIKLNIMSIDSQSILGLRSFLLNLNGSKIFDYLDLSYNYIKDEGINLLHSTLKLSYKKINIQEINLSKNFFTQSAIESLEGFIIKCKNLRQIDLSHNSLEEFSNCLMQQSYLKLNLSNNQIKDIPLNFFHKVNYLDLSSNQIHTKGAYKISQVLSDPQNQWETLNLSDNLIMPGGFISIIYALVKFNSNLKNLMVANTQLDGHALLYYISNHEQINLFSLDISRNQFRYQLIYALFNMMRESKLNSINISSIVYQPNIKQEQYDNELLFEIKSTQLRNINFSKNPSMIFNIMKSLSFMYLRLENVDLSQCNIVKSDSINLFIKFLRKAWALQTLNVARNDLGLLDIATITHLASALGLCLGLISLNISNNNLNGLLLKPLLLILANCTNLRYLDMSDNNIDDSHFRIFKKFIQKTHAQEIILANNQLNTQSLNVIQQGLRNNYLLQSLNLKSNGLNGQNIIALEQMILKEKILSLNLGSNKNISMLNGLFFADKVPIIKQLSFNHAIFNNSNFDLFLQTLNRNQRYLNQIQLHSVLSDRQFKIFYITLPSLTELKKLSLHHLLSLEIPIVDINQKQILPIILKLESLSIESSLIPKLFYEFLVEVVEKTTCLMELNLSRNFPQFGIQRFLPLIIQKTQTIQSLILQDCNIDDNLIEILIPYLSKNNSLKLLDLSFNKLTVMGFYQKQKLQHLILKQNNFQSEVPEKRIKYLINFNKSFDTYQQMTNNLDLQQNIFNNPHFDILINIISDKNYYPNLWNVNFSNCKLEATNCDILTKLIECSPMLYELDLSNNSIQQQGFTVLLDKLNNSQYNLQILNVSKNQIGINAFGINQKEYILKSLIVLNISENQIIGQSTQIIKILTKNPNLFIYNNWKQIDDKLAFLIVNTYVQLGRNFSLKTNTIPNYLKTLQIEQSNLTDTFCVYFSEIFHNFSYIQTLSFSKSPLITIYGKTFLYLTIFQECYQEFKLKHFYFDDIRDYPIIFDDGIWNYLLMSLKIWIQFNNNQKVGKYIDYDYLPIVTDNNIRGGNIGKILISFINNLIKPNPDYFSFSSPQIQIIEKFQKVLKIITYFHFLFQIFIITATLEMLQQLNYLEAWDKYYKIYIVQCPYENYCFYQVEIQKAEITDQVFFIVLIFLSVMVVGIVDLYLTVKVRRLCVKDKKIISFNQIIREVFPNGYEILLSLITMISNLSYYYDTYLIIILKQFINWTQNSKTKSGVDYQNLESQADSLLKLVIFILCMRIAFFIITNCFSLKNLYSLNLHSGRFLYLNALWRNSICQQNYTLEKVLSQFCPQSGFRIFGPYFSYHQIYEIIQALIFEIPMLVAIIQYKMIWKSFLEDQLGRNLFVYDDIVLIAAFFRCSIKLLFNLNRGITAYHPKIKEQEFNQALFLRNYNKDLDVMFQSYSHQPEKIISCPIISQKQKSVVFNNKKTGISRQQSIHLQDDFSIESENSYDDYDNNSQEFQGESELVLEPSIQSLKKKVIKQKPKNE